MSERARTVRKEKLKRTRGNGPVRLLNSRVKISNDDILLRDNGIVPLRLFLLRYKSQSLGNMPNSLGMPPLTVLL